MPTLGLTTFNRADRTRLATRLARKLGELGFDVPRPLAGRRRGFILE
jgi:hypothetical protein